MALVECPECGGKVSTEAASCPHCGYAPRRNRTQQNHEEQKAWYEQNIGIFGCLLILLSPCILMAIISLFR